MIEVNKKDNPKEHIFMQVRRTKNNLFIAIKDKKNELIYSASLGSLGFDIESRKTYFAYYALVRKFATKLKKSGTKFVQIEYVGHSFFRRAIINAFVVSSIRVTTIVVRDLTAHGGCRLKKKRRK